MPTVQEVAAQVKWLLEHHRGHEKAVLVLPRVANRRKQKNPQKQFRKMMENSQASDMYAEWDRWLESAGNKTIAIDLIIMTLKGVPSETIRDAANEQADVNYNMGKDDHAGE